MAKGKKIQKEDSEDDDEPEVVVDLDGKDWDTIEPPGEVDSGDEDNGRKKEEDTEGMDLDEKGVGAAATVPTDNKGCFSATALQFTEAELPVLGYFLASIVFFLAAVTRRTKTAQQDAQGFNPNNCGRSGGTLQSSHFAYALCLGLIGALMAGALFGWMRYNAGLANERNGKKPVGDDVEGGSEDARITTEEYDTDKSKSELFLEKYKWVIDLVLFLWAFIGWAFFTFGGGDVFAYTGNGFFALWAMMIFAIWNFGISVDDVKDQAKKSETVIYAMILGSVIAIIELTTGPLPFQYRSNKGIASYTVAVAVIAIVFGLVTMGMSRFGKDKIDTEIQFWCLLLILVLWIVAACLTTFIGPFLTTGNGYFAVWGSAVFAGMATQKERQNRSNL